MAGEHQLEQLKREEKGANIEGISPPVGTEQRLTRARRIEETAMISGREREDPVFEASYQRALKEKIVKASNKEREANAVKKNTGSDKQKFGGATDLDDVTNLVERAREKKREQTFNLQKVDRKTNKNTIQDVSKVGGASEETQTPQSKNLPLGRKFASEPAKEPELSFGTSFLMVGTAILFDTFQFLIELIPVVGQILSMLVTMVAWCTFALWAIMSGVKFSKTKKLAFGVGGLIEFIPIISMLPTWTLSVMILVSKNKIDKLISQVPGGNKVTETLKKAA